jgi:hypothetical protein
MKRMLGTVVLVLATSLASACAARPPLLFESISGDEISLNRSELAKIKNGGRERVVRFSLQDAEYSAALRYQRGDLPNTDIWTGRIEGYEMSTVAIVAVDSAVSGRIQVFSSGFQGSTYTIRSVGGKVKLELVDPSRFPPELPPRRIP